MVNTWREEEKLSNNVPNSLFSDVTPGFQQISTMGSFFKTQSSPEYESMMYCTKSVNKDLLKTDVAKMYYLYPHWLLMGKLNFSKNVTYCKCNKTIDLKCVQLIIITNFQIHFAKYKLLFTNIMNS